MRITFLVRNIWGIGGTIRTTLNTALALVERGHDVRIVSCVRPRTEPDFPIDERIDVTNLLDVRDPLEGGERLSLLDRTLERVPGIMDADKINNMRESSRLFDRRIAACLRDIDTDVLVGTHNSLNLYMARFGRPDTVKVAQEHLYFEQYRDPIKRRMVAEFPRLDAIVTISEADAAAYREALPGFTGPIECVPNSIPRIGVDRSEPPEDIVMAAGRLTGMKGFDLLIPAFARTAALFPDWRLRIFGRGRDRKKLQRLIEQVGEQGRIELMGPVSPLDTEWGRAKIAAVPSRFEPFGLVIVEAMAAGLPVVCTAVKHGPLEIVTSEENGILVPPKDVKALGAALARLMGDEVLRKRLADEGRSTAQRFEPEQVVGMHERLFERLLERR
jgi:glycosyltransferase involved in cell wall biosynthesis